MADIGEEHGLGPVQFGELLRAALLVLVAACARDSRPQVPGHQADERAVALVQGPVPVQGGHQEPVRGTALLGQRCDQRLDGRLTPRPGRQDGEPGAGQAHQRGFTLQQCRDWPHRVRVPDRQRGRGGRVPGCDAGAPRQPGGGGAVVAEQVGQGERQVLPVAIQLPSGEVECLLLGADHARVRAQIAQGRHPALADDAFGVLADHAQHADHGPGVVAQRTVGEGVVALLRVARPLQEQQQRLVPGRLPRGQHGVDPRADVVPDLRPHLASRPAQRPRVLAAQRVAPVGGVAEECQLRPPRHPHRKAG